MDLTLAIGKITAEPLLWYYLRGWRLASRLAGRLP